MSAVAATLSSQFEGRTSTATLVKDVMILVAQYCNTSELLLLRRVSKDWSVVTHAPAAWISSHWQLQTWRSLESLLQSMPYLRSLTFPMAGTSTTPPVDLTITPDIYHRLSQLVYLERINSCQNLIYLPFSLVRLKHLEYHSPRQRITNTVFTDVSGDNRFVEPTEATTIQRLHGLLTLRILADVEDHIFRMLYNFYFWLPYLLSLSASSLITLVIPNPAYVLNPTSLGRQSIKWTNFSSLEECDFGPYGDLINYEPLVQIPRLRMLTLETYVSSVFILNGLFSNPALNTRLEYFHVRLKPTRGPDSDFFTSYFIHQIMTQFTSLLVLRLTGFKKRFTPLNRDDWNDRLLTLREQSLSGETSSVSPSSDINDLEGDLCRRIWQRPSASDFWKSFWSDESRSLGCSMVNCGCLQVFSFGQLLTTKQPSARESLRFIELPRRWKCAVSISDPRTLAPFPPSEIRQLRIQLMTRMPRLIQAQFGEYQSQPITPEDEAGHYTAKVTQAELDECRSWMNEPDEDVVFSLDTPLTATATLAIHPPQPMPFSSSDNFTITSTSSTSTSSPPTPPRTKDEAAAADHSWKSSVAASAAMIGPKRASPAVERGSLTPNEWSYQSTSPFLFVRAIKLAVGLPLQPSESNPDLLHRWES